MFRTLNVREARRAVGVNICFDKVSDFGVTWKGHTSTAFFSYRMVCVTCTVGCCVASGSVARAGHEPCVAIHVYTLGAVVTLQCIHGNVGRQHQ